MATPLIARMSGAGNTFFFWNLLEQPIPVESRSGLARFLCDSFEGFYTDGLVFLEKDPGGQADFKWDFYNADGSHAEMCGNAARCAALYFQDRMGGKAKCTFMTAAGLIAAEVHEGGHVEVLMPALPEDGKFIEIALNGRKEEFFFVNTGVPHLVVEGEPQEELAKVLRRAPELGKAGANVTFFSETAPGEVEAITFERGVENFTLACGTGAVAAAAFSMMKNPLLKKHSIEMPGGQLQVEWKTRHQALLSGPAQFEFDLSFSEGIL